MKKDKDLKDYSKDAFLHIPPASAQDYTGYTPFLPTDTEADNIGQMMDVPASGNSSVNHSKKER